MKFCDVFVILAPLRCVGGYTFVEPPTLGLEFCNLHVPMQKKIREMVASKASKEGKFQATHFLIDRVTSLEKRVNFQNLIKIFKIKS